MYDVDKRCRHHCTEERVNDLRGERARKVLRLSVEGEAEYPIDVSRSCENNIMYERKIYGCTGTVGTYRRIEIVWDTHKKK